jgi:hypothetical protein
VFCGDTAKILSPTLMVFLVVLMSSIVPTSSSDFAAPIMQASAPETATLQIMRIAFLLGRADLSGILCLVQRSGRSVDDARPSA